MFRVNNFHHSLTFTAHFIYIIGTFITPSQPLDILAVNKIKKLTDKTFFWVLLIESKNSSISPSEGLPQLLTYASESLNYQTSVWGLVTNGQYYQFVYIEQGNPTTYYLMPLLNLMESNRGIELLQVLKVICQL